MFGQTKRNIDAQDEDYAKGDNEFTFADFVVYVFVIGSIAYMCIA